MDTLDSVNVDRTYQADCQVAADNQNPVAFHGIPRISCKNHQLKSELDNNKNQFLY